MRPPDTADPIMVEARSDLRVVLLDAEAERQWVTRIPGRQCLRCSVGDWRAVDEWLEDTLAQEETRMICAVWMGQRLGLNAASVLGVSPPLHGPFASRLLRGIDRMEVRTSHLCTEMLGWTPRILTERLDRWDACASLLPRESLPLWIMDASEDLALALRVGDRFAMVGLPIGLRVCREKWAQVISADAWDRCTTRWRLAPVLCSPTGGDHSESPGDVEQLIRTIAPEAMPLLEKARIDLAAGLGESGVAERARSVAEELLFTILDARPATRGRFRLNAPLDFTFGTRIAEGDLTAPEARLVIEIDGYYHFRNTEDYRRDRRKDALLQEHGWFVLRFLAEDVVERLEETLRQIEAALVRRMAKLNRVSLSNHG